MNLFLGVRRLERLTVAAARPGYLCGRQKSERKSAARPGFGETAPEVDKK